MSYTASKAQSSQGTLVWINPGNASPADWILIGEAKKADFSDKNMFADVTNLQSTAKEFLATLKDPGKLAVDLNRVSTDEGQAALATDYYATPPNRSQYKVQLPVNAAAGQTVQGDEYLFLGYVEQLSPTIDTDKPVLAKFSIQITGQITLIEGS